MKYTLGNSNFEVNGKQYLKDVGGYNGTNKDSSKDVATVIEDVTTAIDSKIDSMLSVNYFELVNLRDNGQLIPGQQYRITDYITTTSQENTESAGHQFDIIVTANSNNTLNEIASACLHEGDTYFSENGNSTNLSAWQIWYCLDNDTDKFEWAMGYSYDSDNQLYEFNNWVTAVGKVCDDQINTFYETEINEKFSHFGYSEDLDGIQRLTLYGRMLDGDIDEGLSMIKYHYSGVYKVDGQEYDGWAELSTDDGGLIKYATDENGNPVYVLTERTSIGKGVIYRMIDEWGNDCPYDFKNIKFTKPIISETYTPDSNFYYTFCSYDGNSSNIKDGSIIGNNYSVYVYVYNNIIKPYYVNGKQSLNRILFIGNNCYWYSNTFGVNCYKNTFGVNCYNNTFGNNCYNNTFGSDCQYNTFGNNCNSNTFGYYYCQYNKFGDYCYNNKFGYYCRYNKFGDYCNYNKFGNNCYSNTFGNECQNNPFGNNCQSNTFGNNCRYNTFGIYCNYNTFGNGCVSNTFGDYCSRNTFGNYCLNNVFGEVSESGEITPKSYYRHIIFDNGNCYICLNCDTTSSSKYYQNVRIGLGVNNKNTYKTINDSNYNQAYETLYKPTSSKTITL